MLTMQEHWSKRSWHCPNCGNLVSGYPNADGNIKVTCCKCAAAMVMKNKGRRHSTLEVYAPTHSDATQSINNNITV